MLDSFDMIISLNTCGSSHHATSGFRTLKTPLYANLLAEALLLCAVKTASKLCTDIPNNASVKSSQTGMQYINLVYRCLVGEAAGDNASELQVPCWGW